MRERVDGMDGVMCIATCKLEASRRNDEPISMNTPTLKGRVLKGKNFSATWLLRPDRDRQTLWCFQFICCDCITR